MNHGTGLVLTGQQPHTTVVLTSALLPLRLLLFLSLLVSPTAADTAAAIAADAATTDTVEKSAVRRWEGRPWW